MHNIEFLNGRHNFVYAGEPTWHGLGKNIRSDLTPEQVLVEAGLDWTVEKKPTYIRVGDQEVETPTKALVRSVDNKILTMVSDNWEPLQNRNAFSFFDDFVMSGGLAMETAGSLKGGQIVFALAKVKNAFEVFKGDVTESYVLFTNPHMYGKTITVMSTATRVVCSNTLAFALESTSQTKVRVNHCAKFDPDYVKDTMGLVNKKFEDYGALNAFLAKRRAKPEMVDEYLSKLFPSNSKDEKTSRPARIVRDILDQQPGAEYGEGSWYQVFNGVTFATNHLLSKNNDTRTASLFYGQYQSKNLSALELATEYAETSGQM